MYILSEFAKNTVFTPRRPRLALGGWGASQGSPRPPEARGWNHGDNLVVRHARECVGAAQHSRDDAVSIYRALATSRGPQTDYIKIYKSLIFSVAAPRFENNRLHIFFEADI